MSKLRVRQDADGYWSAFDGKSHGLGESCGEAFENMMVHYWMGVSHDRSAMLREAWDKAETRSIASKRRLNTWRSIAIAQFVVIVATGAIMWIGG
jgi:hypothetical protein